MFLFPPLFPLQISVDFSIFSRLFFLMFPLYFARSNVSLNNKNDEKDTYEESE